MRSGASAAPRSRTSRIRPRSANSFRVNHEKPNLASAPLGGSGVRISASPRQARCELAAPEKKVSPSRNSGSETANSSPPPRLIPISTTALALLENEDQRMGEATGHERLPIEAGGHGLKAEFAGERGQARDRNGRTVDEVAALDRLGIGIDPDLHAEPEQAGKPGIARHRRRRGRRRTGRGRRLAGPSSPQGRRQPSRQGHLRLQFALLPPGALRPKRGAAARPRDASSH